MSNILLASFFSNWWVLAVLSGAGLAARNVSFKAVNNQMDTAFAALVLSLAMTTITVIYYCIQRLTTHQSLIPQTLPAQPILLCIIAGGGVAFANILLAFAYKQGGFASLTAILQNGFSIIITLVLGFLLLSEVIRPMQLVGILITFGGMMMITKG